MDSLCIFILGASTESVRKLRRTNSMTLAETELIMAAGESSKFDLQEFIEKQRQMFREFECKNVPDNQGKDVIIHDEERTDSAEDFHLRMLISKTLLRSGLVKLGKGQFTTVWPVVTPRIADEKLLVSFKHKVILYNQHNIRQVSSK